jgi:hypothetical protein
MSGHFTDEELLAILHGEVTSQARAHLASCEECAKKLAREACLDQALWVARPSSARAATTPVKPVKRRARRWVVGGGVAVAAAAALAHAGVAQWSSAAARASGDHPLAWQNLIFYIPLAVGLLLILGSAFGAYHHDADGAHDAHHDADHDADGGILAKTLQILGVGRVPLTILIMIGSLVFGGVGIITNTILSSLGLVPALYAPISIAVAFVGGVSLTGSAARLLDRLMPTTETYLVSRHDFVGCTGTLLLPADPTSGYAQVKDPEGNVHNIKCRTVRGELPKGAEILIIEYDERTSTYVVDANPVLVNQQVEKES